MNRKLRMGMVGGGRGAFIGGVHRMAAALDGKIELVAGCFSSTPKKSKASGADFYLNPKRVYGTYAEMAAKEAALPPDQRIDFVTIVTPNNSHFDIASSFLRAGINVICDKPMTVSLAQAKQLRALVRKTGLIFAITHNYAGYPMVKEARDRVRTGKLGRILKVVVEYPQGYACTALAGGEGGIASWRLDPKIAGATNCMGDVGTHAVQLVRYITGLEFEEICAELSTFVPNRKLDDDGNCLLRFRGGAKGILFASQISNGDENGLAIRVWGSKSSIEWHQEVPEDLIVKTVNQPHQIFRRGNSYVSATAQKYTRTPFGHPEGFIEAFANIYRAVAEAIADKVAGRRPAKAYDFPNIDDGVEGMAFIECAIKSSRSGAKWVKFPRAI